MYTLLQYVENVLKPTCGQVSIIPSKINKIANVIKNNSALSLNMVIPGGSYEKGTMLKYKPDVDLVLVFNKEPGISRN
jgi:tRNA nucleotidyltransferase (CCA-adding enzyme)